MTKAWMCKCEAKSHCINAEKELLPGCSERMNLTPGVFLSTQEYKALKARGTLPPISNPYSAKIFPMTVDEYMSAVPNPHLRTAISGYLMRLGWEECLREIQDAVKERAEDETEEGRKA